MIALVANSQKYDCYKLSKEIAALLLEKKKEHVLVKNHPYSEADKKNLAKAEILIILGGDGTILSTLSEFTPAIRHQRKLIAAVNMGTLAYMASIPAKVALSLLRHYFTVEKELWAGYLKQLGARMPAGKGGVLKKRFRLCIDKRSLLQIELGENRFFSLNEVCMLRKDATRPLTFKIKIAGEAVIRFSGDGVLVSTATGSTAYNLSAGGPILSPNIDAYVLTPVSPHSLTVKPIVLPRDDALELKPLGDASVIIDGLTKEDVSAENTLKVALAGHDIFFLSPKNASPYKTLSQKLLWGK